MITELVFDSVPAPAPKQNKGCSSPLSLETHVMVYSLSGDIYYVPSLPPSSNSLGFLMVTARVAFNPY